MMKKEITKYVVVRDTVGKNGRHYRRFEESNSETHACWFAKSRPLTNANTTIYVYEIEGEMPKKKTEVMESGELILECNLEGVVYDRRKEATAEPEHEASVEPIALAFDNKDDAPVVKPSKWMVGTAEDEDGNLNYVVYRLLDGDAPDEEGNRELRGIFDSIKAARAYATDRNYIDKYNYIAEDNFVDKESGIQVHGVYEKLENAKLMAFCRNTPALVADKEDVIHDEPKAEAAEPTEEAPESAPTDTSEVVRYYVVLQIAENRKQTKFHYKRRVFYDDEDAITFARSRLRGGCKSATVYMYDPTATNSKPSTFETMDAQHDAKLIKAVLWTWEIFYIDHSTERDMRGSIRNALPDRHFELKPYLSDHDNELVKHAQHFDADGTANKSLAMITMLCDADIRNTHDVRLNGSIMTLAEAEEWYQEATV
ncbi:MAG: hypothetical protein PUB60_08885 [Veillonellaceae bacterium]|nr:hypothetical protein [Veillonellaceae bacterium]